MKAPSITLLQQASRKGQKRLHIVEIGDRSHRNPDGTGGFAVDAMTEIIDGQTVFVFGLRETHVQFHARDAQRDLTCAGVTEASRPQRDVDFVGR